MNDWNSNEVRELRQRLRLTQQQMAERLQIHYGTLVSWEQGTHRPGNLSRRMLDHFVAQLGEHSND